MEFSWATLLLLLLFGGVILWLLRNAEARTLMRELSRYGLYLMAAALQNASGRPVGYVQHYRDSVARDAGLKTPDGAAEDDHPPPRNP